MRLLADGRVFPVCVADDGVHARLRRHVLPLPVRRPELTAAGTARTSPTVTGN